MFASLTNRSFFHFPDNNLDYHDLDCFTLFKLNFKRQVLSEMGIPSRKLGPQLAAVVQGLVPITASGWSSEAQKYDSNSA
jgi:hypothetical protein